MKLNNNNRNGYILHTFKNGKIALCKVLNEYNNLDDANSDLIDLLTKNKQEQEVLEDYNKKNIL